VNDIDDHKPHFKRSLDSPPIELNVLEEVPVGSKVGVIEAIDEDIGENGMIDYEIVYGNEAGLFMVQRLENNSAIIKSNGRLDREVSLTDREVFQILFQEIGQYRNRIIGSFGEAGTRQGPGHR